MLAIRLGLEDTVRYFIHERHIKVNPDVQTTKVSAHVGILKDYKLLQLRIVVRTRIPDDNSDIIFE